MKQAIKRVLFSLVLGFGVSWIVAWTVAMIPHRYAPSEPYFPQTPPFLDDDDDVFFHGSASIAYTWLGVTEHRYYRVAIDLFTTYASSPRTDKVEPEWQLLANFNRNTPTVRYAADRLIEQYPESRFPIDQSYYSVITYGLPFPSHIASGVVMNRTKEDGSFPHDERGIFALHTHSPSMGEYGSYPLAHSAYLPYAPLWHGLLYNTLFYALIFFIFTSTKRAFRHARRYRKGRCPTCAYDLQYDNTLGCPECGWRKA